MPRVFSSHPNLESTLLALADLSRDELNERWNDLFGKSPPCLSIGLMIRALAHRMQEDARGGLKPALRRKLAQAAAELSTGGMPKILAPAAKPGTRLLREWNGATHEVIILESGVQYNGQTLRSLSAAARKITGAHWSGPAFFGLNRDRDGKR